MKKNERLTMETKFEDEAGTPIRPRLRKFVERAVVILGSVLLIGGLFTATATAQPSTGSAGIMEQAGAADDGMTEFDWQIMQSWLAQKLGAGFQRFLNGDGGGSGYEGEGTSAVGFVDGPPPCPFCGMEFPDTEQGWKDRALHMTGPEWWKLLDSLQKDSLGTGSANGLWNNMTINPASMGSAG